MILQLRSGKVAGTWGKNKTPDRRNCRWSAQVSGSIAGKSPLLFICILFEDFIMYCNIKSNSNKRKIEKHKKKTFVCIAFCFVLTLTLTDTFNYNYVMHDFLYIFFPVILIFEMKYFSFFLFCLKIKLFGNWIVLKTQC